MDLEGCEELRGGRVVIPRFGHTLALVGVLAIGNTI